jgi:uncharacterized membrane protein
MNLIYSHLFLALATFLTGLYVYLSKQEFRFKNPFVMGYIHLHLLTAITGLFLGEFDISRFSPFQWLSVITIGSYILCIRRIIQKNYYKAHFPMLGAYLGLCIAFAGALHPDRLTGYRFWTKFLNMSSAQASNYWIAMMVLVTVPCLGFMVYYNIKEFKLSKNKI